MKILIKYFSILAMIFLVSFQLSCKKYLNKIPDKRLAVPTTLQDFRQLLDNNSLITNNPGISDFGTDDIFLEFSFWETRAPLIKNAYIWAKNIHEGNPNYDWRYAYENIYICNNVLEGLEGFTYNAHNLSEYNAIKGAAFFLRAFNHLNIQEIFGQPFRPESAATDLGIVLRLNTDLSQFPPRGSVKETFDQIIVDLEKAKDLLPSQIPTQNLNRPSKPAAFALLARTYLIAQEYEKALENADSCLSIHDSLTNYNFISTTSTSPFRPEINEVLFMAWQVSYGQSSANVYIDTALYNSYSQDDLRQQIYFSQNNVTDYYYLKGSYSSNTAAFAGLATDEIYLIRAECNARLGNLPKALEDLNYLLAHRWKTGTYTEFVTNDVEVALTKILEERRKELIWRGLRWSDLRRLNQDPRFAITLTRNLDGKLYVLLPNDPKYTYPIPDEEINLSGIVQNIR